ncbi:unnamed protein product, partial [Staurois parvus]
MRRWRHDGGKSRRSRTFWPDPVCTICSRCTRMRWAPRSGQPRSGTGEDDHHILRSGLRGFSAQQAGSSCPLPPSPPSTPRTARHRGL